MNQFQKVFNLAINDGLLKYEDNFQKAVGESFHNMYFNDWLNANYTIEITEGNYDSVCTYENFKSYLPKNKVNWKKYLRRFKEIKNENSILTDQQVALKLNREQLNDILKNSCYRFWTFIIAILGLIGVIIAVLHSYNLI